MVGRYNVGKGEGSGGSAMSGAEGRRRGGGGGKVSLICLRKLLYVGELFE